MRLYELVNSPDLLIYHFTSGEYLRQIIEQDRIDAGASKHNFNGRTYHGVSLTRDKNLNLLKTYMVSGHKPYRIGLNLQKLRQRFKIIPIRDAMYGKIHKAKQFHSPGLSAVHYEPTYIDTNEAEEFLIGDIFPLSQYWVELAVDSEYMDNYVSYNEHDSNQNMQFYHDLYAGMYGKKYGGSDHYYDPIRLPNHVKFKEIGGPHFNDEVEPPHKRKMMKNPPEPKSKLQANTLGWVDPLKPLKGSLDGFTV